MVIKSRICVVSGILVLGILAASCFGAAEPRNPKSPRTSQSPQTPDTKVAETATRIQQSLDVILPEVNKNTKPTAGMIAGGQKTLEESKRYFSQMDDKQKSQYCLLQSWAAYYADEIEVAYLNAAKACKLDATNGDAWASQVAMSLLSGKKPMMPPKPKPVRMQRNRANGGMESSDMMHGGGMEGTSQIQKGKLDFDLNLFLAEAVGKKFGPLQVHCLNGTTLDYQPGDAGLCVLFWRKFEAKAAKADPNGRPVPQAAAPMESMFAGEMMGAINQPLEGTAEGAFGKLFRAGLGVGGRVKFLAVNLDSAAHKKDVIEEMFKQPQVWAQVLVADQEVKSFSEFGTVSPEKPVLVMADTTGTIRYAGPATGFIGPMLLEGILSGTAGSTGVTEGKTGTAPVVAPVTPADSNSLAAADSNSRPADSNSPPRATQKQTPAVRAPVRQTGQPQSQYKTLSEEDAIQAERLVTYAEDLFMKTGAKHVTTYKRGIELCRQVRKDYPDSEYADRARLLLRKVPENERSKYGITDQELGL
ncbi:MAG: hypothetical protein FJ263_00865 [Planctomycetes bacterium]|nr:hypothetical protein [Planctomycetota bacterium]